jgi:4,5:9,10-diseco-3-hydroxy-5,9,17-trioxoandrosta-1(10),2-diene-4-oate hydrolase
MTDTGIPEHAYADVGEGWRLHYHEAGPADGPVVLFLHGSGGPFVERGFRVIVPDALGFGLSSKPEDVNLSLGRLVGCTMTLLDGLGIDRLAGVIGNSMGGAMAMRLTLDHPDRVDRLVLMAPGGLEARETYMEMAGIKAMIRAIYKQGITEASLRSVFELQLHDSGLLTDETLAERLAISALQPKDTTARLRVGSLEERLGELTCPVLAFWGMNDVFCPPSGAMKIAEQCPDARVVLLTRCGHWVMVEHQATFDRVTCDFLAEDTRA